MALRRSGVPVAAPPGALRARRGTARRPGAGAGRRCHDAGDGGQLRRGGRARPARGARSRGRRGRRGGSTARGGRRLAEVAVVDKPLDALLRERVGEGVGVDREVGQRVGPDRIERPVGIAGHDLHVPVEHHPVSGLRLVPVAERVPALVRLRVLDDRRDAHRVRVGVDPDVGPLVQRPRVRRAAADPALLPDRLGGQFEGQAGERGARRAVVSAIHAVLAPDQRLHLSRGPGLR